MGKALVIMGADFSAVALDTIPISVGGGDSGSGGGGTTYYSLSLSSNDATMGSVAGGGSYPANTSVTITATPTQGHVFVSWSDGNTSASRNISISGNISLVAIFAVAGSGDNTPTTTWYVQTLNLASTATSLDDAQLGAAPFALQCNNTKLANKTVNRIRLRIHTAGTFTVGVASALKNATITQERTITISGTKGSDVEFSFEDINIGDGYFVMSKAGDTGLMYYANSIPNGGDGMFYYNVGKSSNGTGTSGSALLVDIGYYG